MHKNKPIIKLVDFSAKERVKDSGKHQTDSEANTSHLRDHIMQENTLELSDHSNDYFDSIDLAA